VGPVGVRASDSGVRNNGVDGAEPGEDRVDLRAVADVAGVRLAHVEPFDGAREGADAGALVGQAQRDRAPDPGPRAGDDHVLFLDGHGGAPYPARANPRPEGVMSQMTTTVCSALLDVAA
jgi:hypothetical protein